jgi:IS5 family transposase
MGKGGEKIYSLHETATEAIAKGKANKRFEYGVKVSVVSTRKSGFVIGCKAIHGNPYDGHTLLEALKDAERHVGKELKAKVGVDLGYRGHGIKEGFHVIHPRLRLSRPNRLFVRARSKIEATISLLKRCYRLGRNYLKGVLGDKLNALYSAAAHNFAITLRASG